MEKKKKPEFSKIITLMAVIIFAAYGVWAGMEYYKLCKLAIMNNATMPDATLAITCVTTIIGALVSYCLYQFGLKNSRNKYGIDSDGQPFAQDCIDEIIQDTFADDLPETMEIED